MTKISKTLTPDTPDKYYCDSLRKYNLNDMDNEQDNKDIVSEKFK